MKKSICIVFIFTLLMGMIATGCGKVKNPSTENTQVHTENGIIETESQMYEDSEADVPEESETTEDTDVTESTKEPEMTDKAETTEKIENKEETQVQDTAPESEKPSQGGNQSQDAPSKNETSSQEESNGQQQVPWPNQPTNTFTYTEYLKMMYTVTDVNIYYEPNGDGKSWEIIPAGTAIPVFAKCNETGWYQYGYRNGVRYMSPDMLTETKPAKYSPGGEEGWVCQTEDGLDANGDMRYTGLYKVNGFEVHVKNNTLDFVDRQINYAKEGLYQIIHEDVYNNKYWAGSYVMLIESDNALGDWAYRQWMVKYMEKQGLVPADQTSGTYQISYPSSDEMFQSVMVFIRKTS